MKEILIVAGARTPIGAFQGRLGNVPAPKLGSVAIRAAVQRAAVEPGDVDLVVMGNVLQGGVGQAPARQAALGAGLMPRTPCETINKVCGSGLEAVVLAARAVETGDARIAVAGGMESMTLAPYAMPQARAGLRMGHGQVVDLMIADGLWDPYKNVHMGVCAETCAREKGITRQDQDAFAVTSYERALAAIAAGRFKAEIVPVEIAGRKGEVTVVDTDEEPFKVDLKKIGTLRPAFDKEGTVTAANASSIDDGGAAVVVADAAAARERGLTPQARIVAWGYAAQEPEWFTTAPTPAIRSALARAGWDKADVDLWEINEAFAVVALVNVRALELDPAKVNVNGGAVALGHPIGASGARLLVTLLHAMKDRGAHRGVVSLCIGGGEGIAMCVERP